MPDASGSKGLPSRIEVSEALLTLTREAFAQASRLCRREAH
jgi:hypothetical protein